ncbi:MAG: ABC transporter substrate-binding protein [Candidatus Heimdallarchaeota archaeon]|nr:MAG: ABC transporter substrate-binding protein [Candidatus Heimdallarchaeota archaeon]
MNKKQVILIFPFLFLSVLIFPTVAIQSDTNQNGPIKIGIFLPETAGYTTYAPWVRQGFELGMIYASDGTNTTSGGRPYELHYYDTKGSTSEIVGIVTRAIETDGMDILVGGVSSDVATGIIPIASQYETLYFIGPAASAELTGNLFDKHAFRIGRNSHHDAKTSIYHSMEIAGAKKIAFLAVNVNFGHTGVAAMRDEVEAKGGEVVMTEMVPLGTTDFTPYLSRLRTEAQTGAGIDMLHVIWAGSFSELWRDIFTLEIYNYMNISNVAVDIYAMNILETELRALGGTIIGGQGMCVYGYELPNNSVNDWMVEQHIERNIMPNIQHGLTYRVPELFTASAFGTAQFLVNVTSAIPDLQIDKMISHLEGLNITCPKGPTYIRPYDHQGLAEMYIADIVNDTRPGSETENLIIASLNKTIPALEVAPPIKTDYDPYATGTTTTTTAQRTFGNEYIVFILGIVAIYCKKKRRS